MIQNRKPEKGSSKENRDRIESIMFFVPKQIACAGQLGDAVSQTESSYLGCVVVQAITSCCSCESSRGEASCEQSCPSQWKSLISNPRHG